MDEFGNFALIKRIAVHWLLADRAIRQPFVRLLYVVKDNRAFAEANIFVADCRRSPAPRFPASVGAANQARVSARVDAFHGDVMPPHGNVIIDQKFRGLGVADLPQSLRRQRLLDSRADALANDFIVRAGFARDGFSSRDHVARDNGTPVRVFGWRDGLPGPRAPLGYGN